MADADKQTKSTGASVNLDAMSVEEKVKHFYNNGNGKGQAPSIQDIARVLRLNVEEVLHILDMDDLTTVTTQGDLIDSDEAGIGAQLNYGQQHRIKYTTD